MYQKKLLYVIGGIAIGLAIWIIYSMNQPPKWSGNSQDGLWRADYDRETDAPKGDWIGYLYWLDENDAILEGAEITLNGEPVHQLENRTEQLTKKENRINYLHSWESMFQNKDDHLQIKIYWSDKKGKHEDMIELSPKNRYFVLPIF
ncbi:MAG: hypothetical protein ACI4XL_05740 [Bacillus sp. (in: firmicutes)]